MADAAGETNSLIEHYGAEDPFPFNVLLPVAHTQEALKNCVNALILHKSMPE
jgi:hypothetical protein